MESTSMQKFEITLKNERARLYTQLSWLILFIHIAVFLYLGLFLNDRHSATVYISTLILLGVGFLLKYYLHKTRRKWQLNIDIFFLLLMIGLIFNRQYLVSVIPCIFYILSPVTVRKLVVTFSEEKITYPSFPVRTIRWKDLNNVMLKDGLLTIDFRNNKLIQQFADETKTSVNEEEFNEFCKKQVKWVK